MKNTHKATIQFCYLIILFALTGTARAEGSSLASSAGLFVYPSNDQSEEQQGKDDYECFTWSKKQTGHDPMKTASAAPEPAAAAPKEKKRKRKGRLKGAARGALVGAVIDEIHEDDIGGGAVIDRRTGNDNKAAKTGAVLGATRAGASANSAPDPAPAPAPAVTSSQDSNSEGFKKAFTACLSARGYSVQ